MSEDRLEIRMPSGMKAAWTRAAAAAGLPLAAFVKQIVNKRIGFRPEDVVAGVEVIRDDRP